VTRLEPLSPAALPPDLLRVLGPLVFTVWAPGEVPMELKRLVGLVSSVAGGCQYCVAHNAHGLDLEGVSPEKQAAVWEFETSDQFTAAERAALRVPLEAEPRALAERDIARHGWHPGRHGGE